MYSYIIANAFALDYFICYVRKTNIDDYDKMVPNELDNKLAVYAKEYSIPYTKTYSGFKFPDSRLSHFELSYAFYNIMNNFVHFSDDFLLSMYWLGTPCLEYTDKNRYFSHVYGLKFHLPDGHSKDSSIFVPFYDSVISVLKTGKHTLANSLDLEFGSIKKYENLGIAKDVFSVDIKTRLLKYMNLFTEYDDGLDPDNPNSKVSHEITIPGPTFLKHYFYRHPKRKITYPRRKQYDMVPRVFMPTKSYLYTSNDSHLSRIAQLVYGTVGYPNIHAEIERIYNTFQFRISLNVPKTDEQLKIHAQNKDKLTKYGTFLLESTPYPTYQQVLDFFSQRVLITDYGVFENFVRRSGARSGINMFTAVNVDFFNVEKLQNLVKGF